MRRKTSVDRQRAKIQTQELIKQKNVLKRNDIHKLKNYPFTLSSKLIIASSPFICLAVTQKLLLRARI